MLLLRDPVDFGGDLSPEAIQAIIEKYAAWSDRMRGEGVLLRGVKLEDGTGRTMRVGRAKPVVTDGPFTEAREVIGGFFEIVAENYDHAVRIAQSCPHAEYGTSIEVRQVEIG
jgi:hypothetical protein